MKTTLLLLLILSSTNGLAQAVQDEVLSQKYENLILDGEDKDIIEDQMTQDGVTKEDLELSEEMENDNE